MRRIIILTFALLFQLLSFGQAVLIFKYTDTEAVGDAEFSISETKKIHFAKGNLMYQPSTKKWRIAPRQYDFVGGDNKTANIPNGRQGTIWENGVQCDGTSRNHVRNYTGWLDVFTWGASGWYGDDPGEDDLKTYTWRLANNPNQKITVNPYDLNPNKDSVCLILGGDPYQGMTGAYANADWGIRNNIALGGSADSVFRTPTKEEFEYLLTGRENAESLRARGHIRLFGTGSNPDTIVNGLIFLPDNWDPAVLPETTIVTDAEGNDYYETNEFTAAEWQILEEDGAIFLPATGNTSKFNRSGFYWTSTSWKNNSAWNIEFGGYYWSGGSVSPALKSADKGSGRAVRLVMEIKDKATPEPAVVTRTCDSYEKVYVPGIGGTIESVQDASDKCLWKLKAVADENYQFAYWVDLHGVKTYVDSTELIIDTNVKSIAMQAIFVKSNAYIYEWGQDNVVYRSDTSNVLIGGAIGKAEWVIGDEVFSAPMSRSDYGVWNQTMATELIENTFAGQRTHIVLYDNNKKATAVFDTIVPVLVSEDAAASGLDFHSDAPHTDIQVLEGVVLTIDADKTINGILDIHAGGKVVVNEGVELDVQGIIMRGNGLTKKWPQLVVNGAIINHNSNKIYYDYTLNQHEYYPLALPFDVNCSELRNPITRRNSSYLSFIYNTAKRQAGEYGWEEFDDSAFGAKFIAGKGYSVYAVPSKWNGTRQQQAVMRFPMVADLSKGDSDSKLVDIYTNNESKAIENNRNWNHIGNPYMASITMGHATPGKARAFQGALNEKGEFEEAPYGSRSLRYITYSTDGNRSFEQEEMSNFVMQPFNSYFTQTSYGDKLQFAIIPEETVKSEAPKRAANATNDVVEELETGLILSQGNRSDHFGLLFGDFTDNYELNADLVKEFGSAQPLSAYSLIGATPMAYQALPIEGISRPILVGYRKAAQTPMTFSFDDSRYDRNLLEGLWLTDMITGEVTNLLVEDYTFTPDAEQDDSRFYLSAQLQRNTPSITTALDETDQQTKIVRIYDIFGREILSSVDMLPQGVYVLVDSDGQSRKEIIR